MKNIRSLSLAAVAAAAAVLLSACGSTVKLDENQANANKPAPIANAGEGSTSGVNNGGAASSSVAPVVVDGQSGVANSDLGKSVYFDFDSFVVKDDYKPVVEGNGKYLMASGKKAAIEGNTDERGSKEYNLALGQKRAEAVVKALTLVGVKADQLEAVSFGEEKPVGTGHDEESWAKNRRVDIRVK
ncbi:MAG TPA: peptidoglycan-associated lipoprotein Pal [Aquabacterium sp.]|nr:peptidoglycan-associated lipoprotein Pal [Aquabacterium sp.]